MAGHSKWANIKHKKARNDQKRAKVWTKLIREITVAAREGQTSDPNAHPRLRLAVDKGLGANMPKDTIEKACKRGAGESDGAIYEEVRYEGYGPGGVAIMLDCMTDNRNRTVAEVRHVFSKTNGNMGTDGSVAYMFVQTGIISFGPEADEDAIMEAALDAGADDIVNNDDGSIDVLTSPENYPVVKDALESAGQEPGSSEVTMRPDNLSPLDNDMLDDLDDVQEVYTNADIPDEVMEAAG